MVRIDDKVKRVITDIKLEEAAIAHKQNSVEGAAPPHLWHHCGIFNSLGWSACVILHPVSPRAIWNCVDDHHDSHLAVLVLRFVVRATTAP